jgi:hypothetical protein
VNIAKATRRYESWLSSHTTLVRQDLRLKHQRMAEGVFPFLRATFYRWMQLWRRKSVPMSPTLPDCFL